MPLYPGGPRYGLGLWNSIPGTMIVESATFGIGVWLYASATRPRDRIGRYAFLAYVALLLVAYIADRFSPPPPSPAGVAWPGLVMGVVMLVRAWWFDRHRAIRE